jgi:cbb3-type cytochrome oxidase subunit 3
MFQQFYAGSDLLIWPLIGLGIFIVAFVAVVVYVLFFMRRGPELDRVAALPLDDDDLLTPGQEAGHNG